MANSNTIGSKTRTAAAGAGTQRKPFFHLWLITGLFVRHYIKPSESECTTHCVEQKWNPIPTENFCI